MKVFTTGRFGFVPAPLALALNISAASNHRQARILVAAPTKKAAHTLLTERGLGVPMGNPDFRQAMGNDVDCLAEAGLLDTPVVLAVGRGPVAQIDLDGYTIIGTYTASLNGNTFTPAAEQDTDGQRESRPWKVYSLGNSGRVGRGVADAIGLVAHRTQAEVLVAAHSKAAAYALLTECGMEPASIHDKEFRVDESTPAEQLIAAGVLTKDTVLAMQLASSNTPVVRVNSRDSFTPVGEFVAGEFHRTGAPRPSTPPADEADTVVAQLAGVMDRLNQLEHEVTLARNERAELCRRAAYDLKIAGRAAKAMDISPGRVYQLATAALRTRASQGEFLPGLWVEIEDADRGPNRWARAQVVEPPADAVAPDAKSLWVWVRANDNTFPVRFYQLRAWSPPCSQCPPEEQLTIRGYGALSVHQASKHGVR